MAAEHGFKAKYDYVEIIVDERGGQWHLTLKDIKHAENVEHDETYSTAAEAKEAAMAVAQHHIYVQHNDTVLVRSSLSWHEF